MLISCKATQKADLEPQGFKMTDCSWEELVGIVSLSEIDQSNNRNAFSRLFADGRTVYKIFERDNPLSDRAIETLVALSSEASFPDGSRALLPKELIVYEGRIIGYSMPQIAGESFAAALDTGMPIEEANELFKKAVGAVYELPTGVHAGDLHAGNIMIVGDELYLIDIDGFTCDRGRRGTCPLDGIEFLALPRDQDGEIAISVATDIGCLLMTYVDYLLDGPSFAVMAPEVRASYIAHLESVSSCRGIAKAISDFACSGVTLKAASAFRVTTDEQSLVSFTMFQETDRYRDTLKGVARCLT